MSKIFKKSKAGKTIKKPAETSVIKGTIIGLLVAAASSVVNGFVQYYFTRQQQETQQFIEEKKEFVSACNDYLTQYKVWHDLMQYYAAKDSVPTRYLSYTKSSAKVAYYKWHDDFDAAYGKLYLLSDNEFGSKTLHMSNGLSKALTAFALTDTLSVSARYKNAYDLDLFFQQHWLQEAKRQIFQYNTGTRKQRSDEDYYKELGEKVKHDIETDPNRVWYGDSTVLDGDEFSKAIFPEK